VNACTYRLLKNFSVITEYAHLQRLQSNTVGLDVLSGIVLVVHHFVAYQTQKFVHLHLAKILS
jgi:hypothetical protein